MEAREDMDVNAPEVKGKAAKTRRPKAGKPAVETSKKGLNLRVDVETYERLTIHSMKWGMTISDVVMKLSKTHLREFTMSHPVGKTEAGE